MNQEEINQLISRSRESLRDWNNLKGDAPDASVHAYADMQISYELGRIVELQKQLVKRIELEDFARQYCRCGDDDLSEFSNDELDEAIEDRTADLRDYA